jgi:Cu/Zn superoxide dismutase
MKTTLLLGALSLLFLLFGSYCESKCLYDRIKDFHRRNNSEYWKSNIQLKERVARDLELNSKVKRAGSFTMPIVFHFLLHPSQQADTVLINSIPTNIPIEMGFLNDWYAARNKNFPQRSLQFEAVTQTTDSGIKFVLASIDPNGATTTGFTVTNVPFTLCDDISNNYADPAQGGVALWDTRLYINVYVCEIENGVAGFAHFPSEPPAPSDSVVIAWNQFANTDVSGSTISHEMGHYLGLEHTFDDNTCIAANGGDNVADTPQTDEDQLSAGSGCAGVDGKVATDFQRCGGVVMVENNMDYNSEICLRYFSQGQIQRVFTFLGQTPRSTLLTSPGLGGACTPSCTGKVCGDNGCGGSCGVCTAPATCNAATFMCDAPPACVPDCTGKTCGPDTCGGSCGSCAAGQFCSAAGTCLTSVTNTQCSTATPITLPGVTAQDTSLAPFVFDITPCDRLSGPGLWYSFVGTGSSLTITTCSATATFDSVIHVLDSCTGNCIALNDDDNVCASSSGRSSTVTACFESGKTYYILVESFSSPGTFDLTISTSGAPCVVSEFCSAAQILGAPSLTVINSDNINSGVTRVAGCDLSELTPIKGKFFTWIPAATGSYRFSTCSTTALNPGFDTVMRVFTGDCGTLSCIASNDDSLGPGCAQTLDSEVEFCATAGVKYTIVVNGFSDTAGAFALSFLRVNTCPLGATCGVDSCGGSCGTCPTGQTCNVNTCMSPPTAPVVPPVVIPPLNPGELECPQFAATCLLRGTSLAPFVGGRVSIGCRTAEDSCADDMGACTAGLLFTGAVAGLLPGNHGFHVREAGDISNPSGSGLGSIWNPSNSQHTCGLNGKEGDLGNIAASSTTGIANFAFVKTGLGLGKGDSIIGLGLGVTALPDDCTTQPDGNSGPLVAQCTIGWRQ